MCFFHAPFGDEITRGAAISRLAALSALPILPTISPTPKPRVENAGRPLTAIVGTTALVGDDLTSMAGATILLRGNTIDSLGPAAAVTVPDSAYRIDGAGTYAIPGLIDSHVHFFQSGGLYTRPDAIDLRSVRPYTDELQWIRANLNDTFAQAQATAAAPRVMVAGPLISSVDRAILDQYNDPPIVKIDTVEAARALIDRELAQHTDYVKFWWIVTPDHPAAAFRPVAQAAIEYAHAHNARVVIHATELETARLAVESGTDILAHSVFDTDVDDDFLSLLKSRYVIYCPTLIVVGNYGYTFAGKPNLSSVDLRIANPDTVGTLFNMYDVESALPPDRLARIRSLRVPELPHAAVRNLKRVHDAGITMAAGTDAGNIGTQRASPFYDEALEMVASGLTAKDVLLTATRNGAAMMNRSDLGSIERGKLADIVLLKSNPLEDIRAIAAVDRTIKDGRVYEAGEILTETAAQIVQRHVNAFNQHDVEVLAETFAGASYPDLFARNPNVRIEVLSRRLGPVRYRHDADEWVRRRFEGRKSRTISSERANHRRTKGTTGAGCSGFGDRVLFDSCGIFCVRNGKQLIQTCKLERACQNAFTREHEHEVIRFPAAGDEVCAKLDERTQHERIDEAYSCKVNHHVFQRFRIGQRGE